MITSRDAAKRLGITPQRVTQLIAEGKLSAERLGSQWAIDETSVEERARTVRPLGGRPIAGHARDEVRFVLMNRTYPVRKVVYNKRRIEFTYVEAMLDPERAPIGVFGNRATSDIAAFNAWWRGRGMPGARTGLQRVLDDAQVDVPEELVMRNLGLSLSDQYWICPQDTDLRWEDVNFFNHDFDLVSQSIEPYAPVATPAGAHPDNTSDGNLRKRWVVENGTRMLLKEGGKLNQEPYNELVATSLHRRLLTSGEYVPYSLVGSGADIWSACPEFLSDEEEYVPACYVDRVLPERSDQNNYQHYIACCAFLGAKSAELSLWKMIVCDDIIANSDRHYRNFGLVRNVNTLECHPAPIFDSGSSLWFDRTLSDLTHGAFSFSSKQFDPNPARQLLFVDDMRWFESEDLEGFVSEAVSILSANPLLEERLPYIERSLARRVDRIVDIRDWC